jgi:hypothetical protein
MNDLGFKVTVDEANLILEGLGQLPFARVYALVEKLQLQAKQQLQTTSQLETSPAAEPVGGPRVGNSSNGDLHG